MSRMNASAGSVRSGAASAWLDRDLGADGDGELTFRFGGRDDNRVTAVDRLTGTGSGGGDGVDEQFDRVRADRGRRIERDRDVPGVDGMFAQPHGQQVR